MGVITISIGFSGGSVVNNLPANGFNPWIGTFPGSRKWQPTPVFLPGAFQGPRSLVGYSLWGFEIKIGYDSATTKKITIIALWGLNNIMYVKHLGQCLAQIAFIFLRKKNENILIISSSLFCAKATVLGGFLVVFLVFCFVFTGLLLWFLTLAQTVYLPEQGEFMDLHGSDPFIHRLWFTVQLTIKMTQNHCHPTALDGSTKWLSLLCPAHGEQMWKWKSNTITVSFN